MEIYKSEHPSNSGRGIEGVEEAARKQFENVGYDENDSQLHCYLKGAEFGANHFKEQQYNPLLELCRELKEALELLYNSAEYRSVEKRDFTPYYVGSKGMASDEAIHKAKATIEKANNLLNNK